MPMAEYLAHCAVGDGVWRNRTAQSRRGGQKVACPSQRVIRATAVRMSSVERA
jgi:hypothetical protein